MEDGFEFVCVIEPDKDVDGNIIEYFPQSRYDNKHDLKLNPYGDGPFCHFRIPRKWSGKLGVYQLIVDDKVMYVGECEDLEKRYNMGYGNISPRNCYQGGQPTNCRINNLILKTYKDGKVVKLMFKETSERHNLEASLIAELRPQWNRSGGRRSKRISPQRIEDIPERSGKEDDVMLGELKGFEKFWETIISRLKEKTSIRNWTADRGFLGKGDFTAWYERGNYIDCDSPDAKKLQKVPKKDFEFMYENWKAYIAGRVSRQQLIHRSRFTKYTISIIHHFLKDMEHEKARDL